MNKSSHSFIAIGLMLFALFFGAGNLIFPAFLGQNAGEYTLPATIGFMLTGVGLPLLGVIAVGYSGADLQVLASRVHPVYAVIFTVALYLTIGPCFAIPRTGTVSFEMAVVPFLDESMKDTALYIFAAVFFGLTLWFSIVPGKLVDYVGKIMTPLLLLFLAILSVTAVMSPMGTWQAPTAQYADSTKAFMQGFLDGYNTMDALASLVFGIIVVNAVKQYGAQTNKEIAFSTLRSGLIAAACLGIIYGFLCIIGANSVEQLGIQENGASVLTKVAFHYFHDYGRIIMGVIVLLACLTTSIGLVTACAEYFNRLCPSIGYKTWAAIFSVVSYSVALFGLTTIISASIPVLMCLYPLTISLIFLTFLHPLFGGKRIVYFTATMITLIPAFYDGLHTAGLPMGNLDAFMASLPLAEFGMAWLPFCLIGLVLGLILSKTTHKHEA